MDFQSALSLEVGAMGTFLVLLGSTIAGLFIALTYKKTHRGLSYSASFTNALLLITVVTSLVLLVIGDNLARAIGVFGAFSIIRFRTAIKDPRDLTFVFIALVSGFMVGTGSVWVAGVGVPFLLILTLGLYYLNFGELPRFDYLLHCKVDTKKYHEDQLANFLDQSFQEYQMLNVESREKGRVLLINFNVRLKRQTSVDEYLKKLHQTPGVLEAHAVRSKNDLEF
jgi:hypothetical protein